MLVVLVGVGAGTTKTTTQVGLSVIVRYVEE